MPRTSNKDEEQLTNTFVRMISASDFDDDLVLNSNLKPNVTYKEGLERNYLEKGMILFNAKGRSFFAGLFSGEYENSIAGTTFLVLTVNTEMVLPEYLAWFLNHPQTLRQFEHKKSTRRMPSINIKELSQIEVIIPSLEMQRNIVQLKELSKKKIDLHQELITLEKEYIQAITYKKIINE